MKASFSRTICLLGIFFIAATAHAQVKSSDYEGSVIPNNELLPIDGGNVALISSDKDGIYISTYDADSKLMWEKDIEVISDIRRTDQFVVSRNGKDIYTVSTHGEIAHLRTEETFEVSWTDAATGESVVREFPDEDGSFGHVYSTWANSRYLFVMTTRKHMTDDDFTSEGLKVFRFNRQTLEKTDLKHHMTIDLVGLGHIWEVIRVEEDYVEAYAVTLAEPLVKIALGRFDNNGREVFVKEAEFKIAANHNFVATKNRPTTGAGVGPVSHGYFERKAGQNGSVAVYVRFLSQLQMAYCQATGTYYACGLTHLDDGKALGAYRNDGFVIVKFKSDFQVDKYQEYFDKPVFADDNNFTGENDYMNRHIQCLFDVAGNPVVLMGCKRKYMFSLDGDLFSTKMEKLEKDEFTVAGGVVNTGSNWILKETDAQELMSSSAKLYVIVISGTTQYAVVQESGGDITVMTKGVK